MLTARDNKSKIGTSSTIKSKPSIGSSRELTRGGTKKETKKDTKNTNEKKEEKQVKET